MVSISVASKEFWLTKKEFIQFVKEKTGKVYSEKTSRISDNVFNKLKKELKPKLEDSDTSKISYKKTFVSDDDILLEENSFLSELWFESEINNMIIDNKKNLKKEQIVSTISDKKNEIIEKLENIEEVKVKKDEKEFINTNLDIDIDKKDLWKDEFINEENDKNKEVEVEVEEKKEKINLNSEEKAWSKNISVWGKNKKTGNKFKVTKKIDQNQNIKEEKKNDNKSNNTPVVGNNNNWEKKQWWIKFNIVKKSDKVNTSSNFGKVNNYWKKTTKLTKKDKKKQASFVKKEEPIKKREINPQVSSTLKKKDVISIWDKISIKEFSEKMWVSLQELMKALLWNKIVLSVASNIDFDTASLIWEELGVKVEKEKEDVSVSKLLSWDIKSILDLDKDLPNLSVRAPIVTVMGHVDHGKTKLLDYIRKTDVVWWEAGWITQSIWASQIHHNWNLITFIDTPWHELFTALRSRWSKITDVAIIVVAADDWIKQQTVEAINHAKDAQVPIIVAVTKIDLPNSNIELVKSKLSEHWLVAEDWWWETIVVPISSITWEWIDELLDMVSLQSEILELKYNSERNWVGVILESKKDAKKWITASMILMTWNMNIWDVIILGSTYGKIKRMTNWKKQDIRKSFGWDPIQILWIQDLPKPWSIVEVINSEKDARNKIQKIKDNEENEVVWIWVQNLLDQISAWEKTQLKLILKSDSFWSLEALKYAIWKIDVHENVEIKILHSDVWAVNDSDINLAKASLAFIVWFNLINNALIKKKAENQWVIIKSFDIIYELIDYVQTLATWMIVIEKEEVHIWKLEIKAVFYRKWKEMIVWWKVIQWKIRNWSYLRVYKDEIKKEEEKDIQAFATGKVSSLKKEQENVEEISVGHECGIKIKVSQKLQVWDVLDFFVME